MKQIQCLKPNLRIYTQKSVVETGIQKVRYQFFVGYV